MFVSLWTEQELLQFLLHVSFWQQDSKISLSATERVQSTRDARKAWIRSKKKWLKLLTWLKNPVLLQRCWLALMYLSVFQHRVLLQQRWLRPWTKMQLFLHVRTRLRRFSRMMQRQAEQKLFPQEEVISRTRSTTYLLSRESSVVHLMWEQKKSMTKWNWQRLKHLQIWSQMRNFLRSILFRRHLISE